MNIESVIEILIEKKIVSPDELPGCNDEEIQIVQKLAGKPLPKSYIEFLKKMGRGAGQYLFEFHIFIENIGEIVNFYKLFYAENGEYYPDNFFIFSTYNFETRLYFYFDEGDDPPVYLDIRELDESRKVFTQTTKYENLTAYLYEMIEVYE